MKKHIASILFLGTVAYAEPSVYGFGGGSHGGGYTASAPLETRQRVNSQPSYAQLQAELAEQKERIDGLSSLVDGLSTTLNQLQQQGCGTGSVNTTSTLQRKITSLERRLRTLESHTTQKEPISTTMRREVKPLPAVDATTRKPLQSVEKTLNTSVKKPTIASLYSEGVRLFQKRRYDEAKKRFIVCDSKGYKAAASSYYLGEIAYYTKHYKDAIFYFKKSAGIYDKASYIDVLLLHAGISLEHTGDKDQARLFYENIIENYPQRNSAKIAREKLKRL